MRSISASLPRIVSPPLWLLPIVIAHGLDILTTTRGLHLGLPEANPLLSSVLHLHGELAMYGVKLFIVATLVFFVARLQRRYQHVWPVVIAMTLPVFVVVIHNVARIAQVSG